MSFVMIGIASGIIFSMWIIVEYSKFVDLKIIYSLIAGILSFFSFFIFLIVKEPKIERSYEKDGFLKQTW
jgi:hypothetical protein